MSSANHWSLWLRFYVLIISGLLVPAPAMGARPLPGNVTVPAVLGFGDSIIDPGNNNDILTIIKCNFPPYGKDFMGGNPTGRFCNGRIPTDIIAEKLGLKMNVPAYKQQNLDPKELLTGVSFASGAAGYDPLTSTIVSAIPLTEQLKMFREYKERVKAMVGPDRTDFIISKSAYVVVAGSDDVANTYFDTPFRRKQYDFNAYTDLMLSYASSFVKELYGLGARRIAVFGVPPIGCVPSQRTLGGGLSRECAADYNTVATLFNSKLIPRLQSLQSTLSGAKIAYVDIYNPLLDMINYPSKYGFEEVTKGCCGTGIIEVTSLLCNKFDAVCEDDTKYLFWDSYHPTERGYQMLVDSLYQSVFQRLL